MVFLPQPRPVALSLPTSLTGMDELCLWCNRLNVNGLRCSVKPPFQGLGGLPCQDPGRWPGLWLKRAVGAEENQLYSADFRPIEACRRKVHSGPKNVGNDKPFTALQLAPVDTSKYFPTRSWIATLKPAEAGAPRRIVPAFLEIPAIRLTNTAIAKQETPPAFLRSAPFTALQLTPADTSKYFPTRS